MLVKSVKGSISLITNIFVQKLGAWANIAVVGVACCHPVFSVCCGSVCRPLLTLLTSNFVSVFLAIFCLCCVLSQLQMSSCLISDCPCTEGLQHFLQLCFSPKFFLPKSSQYCMFLTWPVMFSVIKMWIQIFSFVFSTAFFCIDKHNLYLTILHLC